LRADSGWWGEFALGGPIEEAVPDVAGDDEGWVGGVFGIAEGDAAVI
jgi:hypothetical protein